MLPALPAVQLTLLLLTADVAKPEDAIKQGATAEAHPLGASFPVDGTLYVDRQRRRRPDWLEFVKDGIPEPLELWNESTAAVLVFSSAGRHFACTFGYGRSLLDFDMVEPNFGLRVTVNAVNPDRLRSVDLRVLDQLAVTRRVQSSRGSAQQTFGIDPSRDLLRAVTGEPADRALAKRLTGADALAMYANVDLRGLAAKAAELLTYHGAKTYRTRFPWIDNISPITDVGRGAKLDEQLIDALRSPGGDVLYLAAPEVVDWSGLVFRYHGERATEDGHAELDLEAYLDRVDGDELTPKSLRSNRIRAYVAGESGPRHEWPVYRCIVFETEFEGATCLLIEGSWYAVESSFEERIQAALASIDRSGIAFPANKAGQYEQAYNAATAKALGIGLMDRKLVKVELASEPIELCDLFSPERELIHVKRRSASSTLSHLFAQGRVAAEAFFSDEHLRDRARAHLKGRKDLAGLIPTDRPIGTDFTIVYAVITADVGRFPNNLPFFSRLNMVQSVRELRNTLGVSVEIAGIEQL